MVYTFFIAFLHNSCNFQYLILGWSTLVLSPSIVACHTDNRLYCSTLNTGSQLQLSHITTFGVGRRGARGAAAPLNSGRRGLRPPTNLRQCVSETRCEIKLPAVIHSDMAQKRIKFFAPAPRRTATVVQGKLALPGSWRMPRLHDT